MIGPSVARRSPLLVLGLALGLAGWTLPSNASAAAGAVQARIAGAKKQYLAQEYEKVLRLLTPVVQTKGSSLSEQVEALELIGLSHLILGDRLRAREAFESLLRIDPAHELDDPSGSPKLRSFFDSVKAAFATSGASPGASVVLEPIPPRSAVAGRRAEVVSLVTRGLELVHEVILRFRPAGAVSYETAAMARRGTRFSAVFIAPSRDSAYTLEYYIEARDAAQRKLDRAGSPLHPLTFPVGPPKARSPSIFRTWWFWTAIGVAVVGGVTLTAVLSRRETAPQGNLAPGIVVLR
jgi:hypothetical protein